MHLPHVLVVKIGAIGDLIMSLPMLPLLREKGSHVTWIVGKIPAELVEATQFVDELIVVDEKKLLAGSFVEQVKEILALWWRLKGRRYDLIITAHADWRYRLLTLLNLAKKRRSFQRGGARYHGNEYVRLATGEEGPHAPPPLWPQVQKSLPPSALINAIAMAPGGAKNVLNDNHLRRWPIEHYVIVAEKLLARGYKVVLTGSATDEWVSPFFAHLPCENLIGKTSLLALFSLYKGSRLLLTHDSGPLHLGAWAGCPVLALFGPTNPSNFTSPFSSVKVLWEGRDLPCAPCYDGKTFAPCKENVCLRRMTPERVLGEVLTLLK